MSWARDLVLRHAAEPERVPTAVDLTPEMIERAAQALMVMDAQNRLRDIYGDVSPKRAREFARAALEAALDLRWSS